MRTDREVPAWARFLLPVIGVLQLAAVRIVRPLVAAVRAIRH
jgi:hypothetical protein